MWKTGTVLSLVVEVHGPGEGLPAGPGCRGTEIPVCGCYEDGVKIDLDKVGE